VLNLIPLLGKLGLVEPKLTLGQFFDFRLGIDAGGLFKPSANREMSEWTITERVPYAELWIMFRYSRQPKSER